MDELIKAVRSLLADIEAMRCKPDGKKDTGQWFGPFSEWENGYEEPNVEWPNLSISADAVKKQLDDFVPQYERSKAAILARAEPEPLGSIDHMPDETEKVGSWNDKKDG